MRRTHEYDRHYYRASSGGAIVFVRERGAEGDGKRIRQSGIGAWVEGIPPEVHDCAFDAIYLANGLKPPCQRKPGDRLWMPSK